MRTSIIIDDKLLADTLEATGIKTKREAVDGSACGRCCGCAGQQSVRDGEGPIKVALAII